jgi:hypothetical protein
MCSFYTVGRVGATAVELWPLATLTERHQRPDLPFWGRESATLATASNGFGVGARRP